MAMGAARVARCCAAQHGYCPPLRSGVQACRGNSACGLMGDARGLFRDAGDLRWRPECRQRCSGRRGRLIGVASRSPGCASPHPALRATFSRGEKGSNDPASHSAGEGKQRRRLSFGRRREATTPPFIRPEKRRYWRSSFSRSEKSIWPVGGDAASGRSAHLPAQRCAAGLSQACMICRTCGTASRKCCTRRGSSRLPAMLSSLRMASSTVHGAL